MPQSSGIRVFRNEMKGRKTESRLKRREFIKLAGAAATAGLLPSSRLFSFSRRKENRSNVLMLCLDDLRPELGCYGSSVVKSPNIDQIARRGLVFTSAFCQKSLCNPSRLSLLTGFRPDSLGVRDNETHFRRRRPNVVTLPQLFKSHGYESVAIGKVFHGTLPDPLSWSRPKPPMPKIDIYMSPETQARQREREAAARKLGQSSGWIDAYLRGPATEAFDAPDSRYWDGAVADAAISMLEELQNKMPFFLAVGFTKPHLPFVAPKRYWDLYDRQQIPLAKNNYLPKGAPLFAVNSLTELASYEDFVRVPNPTEGQLTETQARLLKHGYYACVSFIDAQVGRVLNALFRLGLQENTIMILWGDNGWKLGEHGSWGKMTNYEVDTRCPLIIFQPRQRLGGVSTSALVELIDVYPTLCDLAGLEPPPNLEGVSMAPLFLDPGRPWKSAVFSQYARGFTYRFMGRAMRTERHRYVEWRDVIDGQMAAVELYDHEADPMENVNIAEMPSHQEIIQQLARQLKSGWQGARPK
jgi:iduronate 2-sulfatase